MTFRRTQGDIIRGGPAPVLTGGAPTSLPAFFPELPASFEARLGFEAHRAIRRELRAAAVDFDGVVETGGWLLGDADHVVVATDPGENSRHFSAAVELNLDRANDVARRFPHLTLRGCWHSHPSRDPVPSATDRRAWANGCKITGDYWLSIITTPARSMYGEPELHGWITTAGPNGYCEPLRLREL